MQNSKVKTLKVALLKKPQEFCVLTFAFCLLTSLAWAKSKLATGTLEGTEIYDLAAPASLQAVVLHRTVSLSWQWAPPEPGPEFTRFGYDVLRDTAVITVVDKTAFTDIDVPVGTHTYKIRVKGGAKENNKKTAHFSDWSDPAEAVIQVACNQAPQIELNVESSKKAFQGTPRLRLHLVGRIKWPKECHLANPNYHIDSGMGSVLTKPLTLDKKGRFDEIVDALAPEDEFFSGSRQFNITVSADDEVGGAVSNTFSLQLNEENPYAPTKVQPGVE